MRYLRDGKVVKVVGELEKEQKDEKLQRQWLKRNSFNRILWDVVRILNFILSLVKIYYKILKQEMIWFNLQFKRFLVVVL